jgi:hypothetical protein
VAHSVLDAVEFFQRLPNVADKAAQLAINTVAHRGGLTMIRRSILSEIAFPKNYLTDDRLGVTKKATAGDLEAVIAARERPTSLARFAAAGTALGSRARIGVRVSVKRGSTTSLKQAWLVNLKNGNVGLAVRLKPGQAVANRYKAVTAWLVPNKVALLYGPSVDQVFREVSEKTAAPISRMVSDEFLRQFSRLSI